MPQVNLATRIDIDTYTRLKEYTEKTKKSIASVTDEALKDYLDKQNRSK